MTSKLLRTTSVIALTALTATAVVLASQTVRAEPGDPNPAAQTSDNPDATVKDDGKPQDGKSHKRDKQRPDDAGGDGGGRRGDNGRDRQDGSGNADGGKFDKDNPPATHKATTPKIINAPNPVARPALEKPNDEVEPAKKIETPDSHPASKPPVKTAVPPNPVLKERRDSVEKIETPDANPASKPPVKTATPPNPAFEKSQPGFSAPGQPRRADDGTRKTFDRDRQGGGDLPSDNHVREDRRPREVNAPPLRPVVKDLNEAKSGRVETSEDGGRRTVIVEKDKRKIVRQGDRIVIQKDEAASWKRVAPGAVVTRDNRGRDRTVVQRRDNTQVVTETDSNGQLLRRYRRDRDGRETVIIDNRRRKDRFGRNVAIGVGVGAGIIAGAAILNSVVDVPPPRVRIPRDKYIVDYERASEDDVYDALNAPPVDDIDRRYTLDQIRATPYLRERMRRVDLDDITFEFGSWDIDPSQYRKLERIARAMKRVINRNPNEVFLIEGYTDAVGSQVDNLTLSDRRAESVSVVLSEEFDVPFENLTTQGYGEEYLKIPTDGPERQNRRVAARRITPLLGHDNISAAPPPRPRPDYDDYRRDPYDGPPPPRRWRQYN